MKTHSKLYIIIMTSWQIKIQEISNLIFILTSDLSNFTQPNQYMGPLFHCLVWLMLEPRIIWHFVFGVPLFYMKTLIFFPFLPSFCMCFSQAPESTLSFSFWLFHLASLCPPCIVKPVITYLHNKYANIRINLFFPLPFSKKVLAPTTNFLSLT